MTDKTTRVRSLRQRVRRELLWLGLAMFVAYFSLLIVFSLESIESTTENLIRLEARSLARFAAEYPDLTLPTGKTLSAYRYWEDIPESLRRHFDDTVPAVGEIVEAVISISEDEDEYLSLLHHVDSGYGRLFVIGRHKTAEVDAIIQAFIDLLLEQALWLSLLIFISIFFLVGWLIRRTTEPLTMLSQWASELGKEPERAQRINFPIEELNLLAGQLRDAVERIRAFNQREHQFLKHASHELRTPLAIIQASLDTLSLQGDKTNQAAVQRALKASANMRRLSTALLWLARESERPVERELLVVQQACNEIVGAHDYLLSGRHIDVRRTIDIETLEIEKEFFIIVVTNLIRNAFQHSADGVIEINISADMLRITNPVSDETQEVDDGGVSGFGLGLQLVQRVCQKLNWHFELNREEAQIIVIVSWAGGEHG